MSTPVHVVCPECDEVNRVPRNRLGAGAKCGKCRVPLFSGVPVGLDERRIGRHIERSGFAPGGRFLGALVWPVPDDGTGFEAAARVLEPQARLVKVNTEEAQVTAGRFGIRSIPTLILFKDGQEVTRTTGAMDTDRLVAWVRQWL